MIGKLKEEITNNYVVFERFEKSIKSSIYYSPFLVISILLFLLAQNITNSISSDSENSLNQLALIIQISGKIFLSFYIGSIIQYTIIPIHYTKNLKKIMAKENTDASFNEALLYFLILALRIILIGFIVLGFTI